MRDAPRPEQLEEQLCVRCGGVRIFTLAFGVFACFVRIPRQGDFDRCIEGFLPPERDNQGSGGFPTARNCPHEPQQELGLLPNTPKHVFSRQGAAPSALPAAGGDSDRGPPYSVTAETSAPLLSSRHGLLAWCDGHIFHVRGARGSGSV